MNILVACEFSGVVRDAFAKRGHDVWSCDLLPTEKVRQHIQDDVLTVLNDGWDMMIAFPPCTYLAVSGARWFKDRQQEQIAALEFVRRLLGAPIDRIALENGHGETKATCLWLKNLPLLKPTLIVEGRFGRVHHEPPSPDRWKRRSRTLIGIAEAMATQWG